MIHERLDIEHWKTVFSLPQLREEARGLPEHMQPNAGLITSPYDIAVLEQLHAETFATDSSIEREPTDVFVWFRGEPEQRAVTKISGLPYREADKPWPVSKPGKPLTFVAQLCFADSQDITPKLPGDVLLIFIEGREWSPGKYTFLWGDYEDESNSEVVFEWVTLGDFPLVSQSETPKTGWQIIPCYGAIHRTWDYPTADGFAYRHVAEHVTPVMEATKIGGACPWVQDEEDTPGTFLCSLGSTHPVINDPFPFLNVQEPISFNEWWDTGKLMIGDVGLMYIFINSYGDIRWTAQGH